MEELHMSPERRLPFARSRPAQPLVGMFGLGPGGSQAAAFELIYIGTFNSTEALSPASSPIFTPFAGTTPFTIHAWFDDSSPNLAPELGGPFAGFRAYAPSTVTIDISGRHYDVASSTDNALAGVTVAV